MEPTAQDLPVSASSPVATDVAGTTSAAPERMSLPVADLAEVLRLMALVKVSARGKPILHNVHVSGTTWRRTDLESTISATPASAVGGFTRPYLVDLARLTRIVRTMPKDGMVTLETLDDGPKNVSVACDSFRARVATADAGDYPIAASMPHSGSFAGLGAAIERVSPFMRRSLTRSTKYGFDGIHVDVVGGRVSATDGKRMAVQSLDTWTAQADFPAAPFIIPQPAVDAVIRSKSFGGMVDVMREPKGFPTVGFRGRRGRRGAAPIDVVIDTRPLDGVFPNPESVTPRPESILCALTIRREEFISALRIAASMTSPESRAVRLSLDDGGALILMSRTIDAGECSDRAHVDVSQGSIPGGLIAFNPDFLVAAAESCAGEVVTLGISGPDTPAILTGDDDGFRAVVMPVTLLKPAAGSTS